MAIILSLCLFLPAGLFAVDNQEIKAQAVTKQSYGRILKNQKKILLNENIKSQLDKLASTVNKKQNRGICVLFSGSSGTGKTMSAQVLGRKVTRDVYRVDLSLVVSKYIGETEKNLHALFNQAEHEKWILFFDEADSLFGKRTEVKDAHDRYANVEVNFLLERLENHNGIVILSSNLRKNLEPVFFKKCRHEIRLGSE